MPASENLTFIALLVLVALIIIVVAAIRRSAATRRFPYFSREFLLTKGEAAFYQVLRKTIPDGAILCFKVRLCDLLDCATAARRKGFWSKIRSEAHRLCAGRRIHHGHFADHRTR